MRGARSDVRQATAAEVRLDAGKSARFTASASVRPFATHAMRDLSLSQPLEGAGGGWRQFIMRLYVGIIKVTVKLELIVADLTVERGVAAPAFLFRKGTRERVDVEAG